MRRLPSPGTLWRTVRPLRLRQIRYQVAQRLLPSANPPPLVLRWRELRSRTGRSQNRQRPFFDGGSRFTFNNESRDFDGRWDVPGARKLWRYNLHYMQWLFDIAEGREEWMRAWIAGNPTEARGDGWDPYPLSLRLFAWCKHFALSGREPGPDIVASMASQAASLFAKLEFHLDGNHLLENLLALAYVGFHLDPTEPRAARTLADIRHHLAGALADQFLPDGGHYELSPMYHAILLERILDLLDVWPETGDPFPGLRDAMTAIARSGLAWLDILSVGDRFALFNDSAYDTAPESSLLLDYGRRLLGWEPGPRIHLVALPDSGYYRAEAGPFTLLFDAGRLGPDHQMGHAQGDMLSFCLWLGGEPVLVHPGNYEYLPGPMRDYCRSTAAHNTLVVDGGEQAEWWASHRVGWRARPGKATAEADASTGTIRLGGSHDGFTRLPGGPVHHRALALTAASLTVQDSLSAQPAGGARIRFHLHPDCILDRENGTIRIRCRAGSLRVQAEGKVAVTDSWHCPEFGLRLASRALEIECPGKEHSCAFILEP